MDWRLWRTVAQDFWQRAPERAHRLHEYFVQYFRVTSLVSDLSYRLLRGWRTLHRLGQLAAAQADAEFFGTKLDAHRTVYTNLRRTVQASGLPPLAATGNAAAAPLIGLRATPDVASECVRRTRPSGSGLACSTDLSAAEQRQVGAVFSAAWREAQRRGDEAEWPYGTPPTSLAEFISRHPRSSRRSRTAAKSRRIVTEHSSRSSP
jgi:hypothetical protein